MLSVEAKNNQVPTRTTITKAKVDSKGGVEVQKGPLHVGGEDHKIVKLEWELTKLCNMFAWVRNKHVP